MKTLLERAKGSALDITTNSFMPPIHNVTLFSPFAHQIKNLRFTSASLDEVQDLLLAISGLCTIPRIPEIDARTCAGGPDSLVASTHPLFDSAVNLENFTLRINGSPSLRHFTFPSPTTFDFLTWADAFPVSQLFNFLETASALRWIKMWIAAYLFREDVPPERVTVLPYVETFSLNIVIMALVAKSQPTYHVPLQSTWNSRICSNVLGLMFPRPSTLH